jgi:hypothetical protein
MFLRTNFEQYAIAAGHNVAQDMLTRFESLAAGGLYFVLVKGRGSFLQGERKIDGQDGDYFEGYSVTTWTLDVLTYAQLDYLRSTFCAGGWDGDVTIYTTLGGVAFYRRNARMKLEMPNNVDGKFTAIKQYPILMKRLTVPV